MKQIVVYALISVLFFTASCRENRKMVQSAEMTPTTDSLCLDILGLRLRETYSEEDVFDILASRIDSLIRLQDMRGNNLIHDNPHMVRINKDGIFFAIARGARKDPILEWKGIPWSHLFIFTSTGKGFLAV